MSGPAEKPTDADTESGGQGETARAEGQSSGGQRDQVRSPNQEVLDHGART